MDEEKEPMTTLSENENSVHNKHDKGYKFLLSNKRIFVELLKSFVKQGWVDKIDESSLNKIDKSFISQDFREQESDLIYRVKMKDQDVIFYLLTEFQSKVDFQMPYRLLLYMVEIWRSLLNDIPKSEQRKKNFRLPSIIPLVLYNGKNKWTASKTFKECLSGYELFGDYVIDFRYILIDVNSYEKESLIELANLIGSILLIDQNIDRKELVSRLERILGTVKKWTIDDYKLLESWVINKALVAFPEEQQGDIKKLLERSGGIEMLANNLGRSFEKERIESRAEGEAIGEARGEAKKQREIATTMIRKGLENSLIAEVTGLTMEQIDELRQLAAN